MFPFRLPPITVGSARTSAQALFAFGLYFFLWLWYKKRASVRRAVSHWWSLRVRGGSRSGVRCGPRYFMCRGFSFTLDQLGCGASPARCRVLTGWVAAPPRLTESKVVFQIGIFGCRFYFL
jgi:hypothetical protein